MRTKLGAISIRTTMTGTDAAVRKTNDEALTAKISAEAKGYFKDQYLRALSEHIGHHPIPRSPIRQPMINRGTYARVSFVRGMVSRFLAATCSGVVPQVVSFGAGHDTMPFQMLSQHPTRQIRYLELEFAEVVSIKAKAIAESPRLAGLFDGMVRRPCGGITATTRGGSVYEARSIDLRRIDDVRKAVTEAGMDLGAPTIFVAECVLVYMEPSAADRLIATAADGFRGPRAFVNYEPIRPDDPFGEQMVANIALRGSPLKGIHAYPTTDAQEQRFRALGWGHVSSMTMLGALDKFLDESDVARINRIEMLDEVEEWTLMMSHYCFLWACSAPDGQIQALAALLPD